VKADDLGIRFPDGTVIGNNNNLLFIFDTSYMEGASK
jgi:hypothetical protein